MFKESSKKPWFGELRTSAGNSVVIYDGNLPSPPSGRVLLYNVDRGDFLQYVLHIVKDKLFDLEGSELDDAMKLHQKNWKKARDKYLQSNRERVIPNTSRSAPKAAVQRDEEDDVEDFDLEDFPMED